MKKSEKQYYVDQFLQQYINPIKQYQDTPVMVFNAWIAWLYQQWNIASISIREYRELIKIDLNDYV